MKIEIGDIVQTSNKTPEQFGALIVEEINGDNAICSYQILDKDPNGIDRPTTVNTTKGVFPLKDLVIIRKRTFKQ
jgi:hypothetical protein